MSGKELSMALGDISDEKLQDALDVYKQKRKTRNIWLRATSVAAALALILTAFFAPGSDDGIVTAPGVLKVYAHDLSANPENEIVLYELKEGGGIHPQCGWTYIMNMAYGLPLTFRLEEEEFADCELRFDISVNDGFFYGSISKYAIEGVPWTESAFLGTDFFIENGEVIYWAEEPSPSRPLFKKPIYVDVVVKANGNIIGYTVIEILRKRGGEFNQEFFVAQMNKTVLFPKVNGEFQNITEEYIAKKISQYK